MPSKLIKTLMSLLLMFLLWINLASAGYLHQERTFVVTAYYSPLPNQQAYITWTYEWDVLNNWTWKDTASWMEVFEWILAAPSNYPFWTKIYFEWYGVWVVEDRGWAIVNEGENWEVWDRIDIWMWYGDEWLQRAINWGKRTVKWIIVSNDTDLSINFSESDYYKVYKLAVYPDSSSEEVRTLQEVFANLGLYSWNMDWLYSSIKDTLIKFQVDNGVIESETSFWAWNFWNQTRATMIEKFTPPPTEGALESKDSQMAFFLRGNYTSDNETLEKYILLKENLDLMVSEESPTEDVKKLQELFTNLELYTWEIDGVYESIENSIINIQIQLSVISSQYDFWAGSFWNQTKNALLEHLRQSIKPCILTNEELEQLEIFWLSLNNLIYKIATKNNTSLVTIKNTIIIKLDQMIENSQDDELTEKLKYILEIL